MACALFLLLLAAPEWTDPEVLKRVYDPKAKVPNGFFVDPLAAPGTRFYWHRNEWVTDDAAEARRWVEAHLEKSSIPDDEKEITEASVTKRGFDFKAGATWFRVHRKAWFAWEGRWVQEPLADGKARLMGTLAARPVTAREAKELAEYDWWIRNRDATGHRVLASEGKETDTAFVHVLETTTFTGGDWGIADEIRRWRVTYTVDRETGRTTRATALVATIEGRKN